MKNVFGNGLVYDRSDVNTEKFRKCFTSKNRFPKTFEMDYERVESIEM